MGDETLTIVQVAVTLYEKVCHLASCRKPFKHQSRNKKYCSDPCEEAAKKVYKGRQKRRRDYSKDAPNRRAQSMSRKQAREFCIATHAMSCCTRCGNPKPISELEDHHRDGNPFNNDADNLTLVCHGCHTKSDTEWRKEKEAGQPISDMRQFKQVGVLMQDRDGNFFVVVGDQRITVTL